MHLRLDIARCLAFGTHPVSPLCAHGRLEVDDDATNYADGFHVDSYGDECGEWFSEECERMGREGRKILTSIKVLPSQSVSLG